MAALTATDWEQIERDYRAGVLSTNAIAARAGVSRQAIHKRAQKRGWQRDLTPRVQEAARAKLALAAAAQVRQETQEQRVREIAELQAAGKPIPGLKPDGTLTDFVDGLHLGPIEEARAVDAAAQTVAWVVNRHRRQLGRLHALAEKLAGDLEEALEFKEEICEDIEIATADDRSRERRARMLRAVALATNTVTLKDLASTLRALIPLEREAFAVDAGVPTTKDSDAVDLEALAERLEAAKGE